MTTRAFPATDLIDFTPELHAEADEARVEVQDRAHYSRRPSVSKLEARSAPSFRRARRAARTGRADRTIPKPTPCMCFRKPPSALLGLVPSPDRKHFGYGLHSGHRRRRASAARAMGAAPAASPRRQAPAGGGWRRRSERARLAAAEAALWPHHGDRSGQGRNSSGRSRTAKRRTTSATIRR